MASIRRIKKDLRYLVDEVIGTALITSYTQPGKEVGIDAIIQDIDTFYEEMLLKINHPQIADGQKKSDYFRKLYDQLLEKVNLAFDNINNVHQDLK